MGLGTGLYDKKQGHCSPPTTFKNMEDFLRDYEKEMGDQIYNLVVKKDKRKISQFNKELLDALTKLKKERDWSLAPTDKTGRWIEAYIPWYIDQMQQKMRENCIKIDINHLEEVHEKDL